MDLKFVDPSTFVVQLILLIIIIWILNKFLFKPYLKYLDEFEDKRRKLEKDYNNIDNLIEEAKQKKEKIIIEAKERGNSLIKEAERLAKQKKDEIIISAEKEANSIIDSSKKEIEKEKLDMLNSIKSRVIDLAVKVNSKIFEKEKASRDYLEKNIESI